MGLTPHCRALECTGPTEMPQSALGFPPLTGMAFFLFLQLRAEHTTAHVSTVVGEEEALPGAWGCMSL